MVFLLSDYVILNVYYKLITIRIIKKELKYMSANNFEHVENKSRSMNIPLIIFFILTYIIFWVGGYFIYPIMHPVQASAFATGNIILWLFSFAILLIPAFGPFISAIIVISITEGKDKLIEFLKQFTKFRFKYYWYLLVIAIPIFAYTLPKIILILFGFSIESVWFNNITWEISGLFILDLSIAGLVEEPGWRGYAVPRMNKKFGPIITSLIIGVIWACWHLTFYFSGIRPLAAFPEFLLIVIVLSFIYTWIYINTESIWLVILFHAFHNLCSAIFSGFPGTIFITLGYAIIVIIILKIYGFDMKK